MWVDLRRYAWPLLVLAALGTAGWLLLHPVNKSRYVAGNRAVLATIPSYPMSESSVSGSGPIAKGDGPLDPTIAYTTVREDRFAQRTSPRVSLGWYRKRMLKLGWRITRATPSFYFNARRRAAYVQVMIGGRGATLIADYRCYAGREPRCL
jgi:hypothetical protein